MAKPNISAVGKCPQAILMGSTAKSHGTEGGHMTPLYRGVEYRKQRLSPSQWSRVNERDEKSMGQADLLEVCSESYTFCPGASVSLSNHCKWPWHSLTWLNITSHSLIVMLLLGAQPICGRSGSGWLGFLLVISPELTGCSQWWQEWQGEQRWLETGDPPALGLAPCQHRSVGISLTPASNSLWQSITFTRPVPILS